MRLTQAAVVVLVFGLSACASSDVAIVRQNLDKYWLYRQTQRTDFLVPGLGQGYSLPANTRNPDTHLIWWGDATIDLGWYIGALATEHYMLTHPELFPGYVSGGGNLNQVRNELCYALVAMDRVDAVAEACWNPTAPDTPGFFIRDDVPASFLSHFPGMNVLGSDFTNPDIWAKEMSQDQVCHVLIGLALVKKLIPSDLVVNGVNLRQHAITRGSQIVDWVHQAGWIIKNPVLGADVVRGPDARAFSTGFNKSCVYLTDGAVDFSSSISGFYAWVWSTLSSPTNPGYDNANNLHMAMSLAATGNGWGDATLDDMMSLSVEHQWYAYVLLYATLYDSIAQSRPTWLGHQQAFSSSVQTMLNLAPSNTTPHHPNNPGEQNTGWCASRKFIRGIDTQNNGEGAVGDQYPGLDYLLLHNLFYIVTPALWQDPTPPGLATNPTPANGATGVAVGNPTLSWTAGSGTTSHDVYFGASNPPAFRQNQVGTTFSPGTLSDSTTYYWRIDERGVAGTTTGTLWSFSTVAVPPGPVAGLAATAGNRKVTLNWINPGDSDFAGTRIMYKTSGYPTGPSDGTLVVDKTNSPGSIDSYVHLNLTANVTYYYKAFAHDSVPNYNNTAAGRTATPYQLTPVAVYTDTFDTGAGGWSITLWQQGGVTPTMGWVAGAGCSGGAVQCVGAGQTDGINAGTREGGEMWKVISTASNGGYTNIQDISVFFDVKVNGLGNDYSGVGGTGDHNLLEEQLTVSFSTNGGSTWTEAGYLNRGALSGLQSCGTRSYDLTGYPACNNNPNFAVKFRWQLNTGPESPSGADIGSIDNVIIKGVGTDTTPPGNVTGFTATSGDTQTTLAWTKPGDADLAGVKILFKTTGYPTSATDGTQCYNGTGTSCLLVSLTNGVTYYYKAFAYDAVPNYASGAQASAIPADVTAPAVVIDFKAYGGNGQTSLSWTKPGDADLAGVRIVFKTTGYPTSATDGTQCYSGMGTSSVHAGLANGTAYYYKAYAFDEVPNYSSAVSALATAAADSTIPAAKSLDNNQVRALRGNIVTAAFTGCFYIQDTTKPWGIRVSSTDAVSVGEKVDVIGSTAGTGAERFVDCMGNAVKITDGPFTVDPVVLGHAGVGGGPLESHAPGMVSGAGAYNVGLLVTVVGKVTQRQTTAPKYFYIDDGTRLLDGTATGVTANVGVKVIADPASCAAGSYVTVKGVVSCFNSGGLRPQILPVSIQVLWLAP